MRRSRRHHNILQILGLGTQLEAEKPAGSYWGKGTPLSRPVAMLGGFLAKFARFSSCSHFFCASPSPNRH